MTTEFTGSCLCGAVTYKASEAPQFGDHCHCVDCRKSSGTGHCSHVVMIVYARAAPSWDVMDSGLPSFETMPPQMPEGMK